ncbi:hypothetical protein VKT23_020339 [Stygiomarasmius scandens]|uniref:Uncharacterized protein n=1 Tax=Marasmiellus scandens TaxID=2682957 RepID=A0ABR1IJB1_9AGAR
MPSAIHTATNFMRRGNSFLTRTLKVYEAFKKIFDAILVFLQELRGKYLRSVLNSVATLQADAVYPSNTENDGNEQTSSVFGTMVRLVGNASRFLNRCGNVYAAFYGIFKSVLDFLVTFYECLNPSEDNNDTSEVEESEV